MKKILWSLISESSEGIFISRCVCALHTQSHLTDLLQPHGLYPTRFLCPWDFPGKSTRVGCHFLLQGIFSTQGFNVGLWHCRQMLYPLSHSSVCSLKKIFLSLPAILWNSAFHCYIFPILLCLSFLLSSQLFVRPSQTNTLPFCIFLCGMVLVTTSRTML